MPTSGIRACTASATEIAYNFSDDPNELYRAEVEFISAEEWSHELKSLLDDLIDGRGKISQDCYNPDTEAGLAYSKIKAVYPKLKKDGIIKRANDSAGLAREPLVSAVLGSIKRLCATSSQDLYEGLQKYIDSKEKKSSEMEYWPLIKVVRVYCKASALSTGTILVDLPGVQDSNAARAAVAENYIKMCNGLWITAGIDRAISNKAAQELLGNSFKRQMKYDGAFSGATFICTKSDDILTAEVEKSLNVEDEVEDYWQKIELLGSEIDELKVNIKGLKKQKEDVEEQHELLEARSEQWEELLEKFTNGEPVYRPLEAGKKRKRKDDHYGSDEIDDSDDSGSRGTSKANRNQKTSLTEDEIDNELTSIKAQKRQARKTKKSITEQIAESKKKLAEVNTNEAKMQSEMRSLCIRGRNKYLKDSIKRDFALGMKELDQDLAIEEDELSFDPDEMIRDYEDVARSLTVFCVSARAYQKLTGRLEKDTVHIDGFASLGDTEIPQLQEYAKGLTEPGRINTCQLFLNDLNQLFNSMRLWSTGETFTAVSKDQILDEKVLLACFTKLDTALRQAIKDCRTEIQQDLEKNLYKKFDRLVPTASRNAVQVATGWGKPRSEGGLFWQTYRATCQRDGKFSGSSGLRDFNAELFEPINKQLAGVWERTFQKRIPSSLRKFIGECKAVLEAFHKDVAVNVPAAAANPAGLNMLCQQKRAHQKLLEATPDFIGEKIRESQREANRGFTPVIQQAMQPAYDTCAGERGGSYIGICPSPLIFHIISLFECNRSSFSNGNLDNRLGPLRSHEIHHGVPREHRPQEHVQRGVRRRQGTAGHNVRRRRTMDGRACARLIRQIAAGLPRHSRRRTSRSHCCHTSGRAQPIRADPVYS